MLRLARAVDALYEAVVGDPVGWTDERVADWAADLAADAEAPPKEALRQVRAGMRNARRLRKYFLEERPPNDWAMAVDQALGGVGWEPGLRLAELELESSGDPEAFDEVRRRFRMVNSVPWREGLSFEEWLDERS